VPTTAFRRAPRGQIVAAFAAVYLVWGSTYLAIRFAIETLPPFLMGGVRFLVAGALLYAWCRARQNAPRPTARGWAWAALVGALMLGGGNGGVVWAETRVASGITALIVATVALWVVIVEWVRPGGKRPAPFVAAGVLLGLVGVGVLVGPQNIGVGGVDPVGALVLNGAALAWAIGTLLARDARMPKPTMLGAAMQMLCGGAVLVAAGLAAGEASRVDPAAFSATSLLALGYLIAFGSLVGYTAYIWLVAHVAPSQASTYAYVNPIVAVLLGWAIADEPVSARMIVASAIIVGAVALVTLGQARKPAPAAAPTAARPPEPRRREVA
jgi:drug/metabolite transporter (DMT)-like permease